MFELLSCYIYICKNIIIFVFWSNNVIYLFKKKNKNLDFLVRFWILCVLY